MTAKIVATAEPKQIISVKIAERNALSVRKMIFVQIVVIYARSVVVKVTGAKTAEFALFVRMRFVLDAVNAPNVQPFVKAAEKNVRNVQTGSVVIVNIVRIV